MRTLIQLYMGTSELRFEGRWITCLCANAFFVCVLYVCIYVNVFVHACMCICVCICMCVTVYVDNCEHVRVQFCLCKIFCVLLQVCDIQYYCMEGQLNTCRNVRWYLCMYVMNVSLILVCMDSSVTNTQPSVILRHP